MRTPFALLFTSCQSLPPESHRSHSRCHTRWPLGCLQRLCEKGASVFFWWDPGSVRLYMVVLVVFVVFSLSFILALREKRGVFLGSCLKHKKHSKAWWLSWYHVSMFHIQQCHTLSGIWINQFFKNVIFLANSAAVVFFSMLRLPCRHT